MRLAPTIKLRVRVHDNGGGVGQPSPQGRTIVKVTAAGSSMMAALSSSNAEKEFADGLAALLTRARRRNAEPGAAATPAPSLPSVNHGLRRNLQAMGFDEQRATCALAACDDDFERSIQWLMDNESVSTSKLLQQAAALAAQQQQVQLLAADGASAEAGAPPELQASLHAMGYSPRAAAAAYAAVKSSDVDRCVDWLVRHTQASSTDAAAEGSHAPHYPAMDFTRRAVAVDAVHSHPVGVSDLSPTLYCSHTPGYGSSEATANPASAWQPHSRALPVRAAAQPRYVGMGALIHGKQAEAQQLSSAVHSGFQDLEVRSAGGSEDLHAGSRPGVLSWPAPPSCAAPSNSLWHAPVLACSL
jgi:UBA/TS-N domain